MASQLAVSLARFGLKTVLVDGDVRKPSQHAVFGLPPDRGLCEAPRNQVELQAVVQATPAENLWILTAGRCDQVAFQALAGPGLAGLMQQLKDQFDFIVVDSGPVLTGPEPVIFGQMWMCRYFVPTRHQPIAEGRGGFQSTAALWVFP